jgi:chaperonin GroES
MNYVTTHDRVVVKPDTDEQKTSSLGIILAYDTDVTRYGTVMSVGPGRVTKKNVTVPVALSVGDRIMYIKDTGIPVKVEGESLLVFKEDEIIGTVDANQ